MGDLSSELSPQTVMGRVFYETGGGLAEGQKRSRGSGRSQCKHESAAALQAGKVSLCVDSSWNDGTCRGKKTPTENKREVILHQAV